jgi:hypothetical protein
VDGRIAPLGYEVTDRKLTVFPEEAATVRLIFRRYLELGSVRLLKQELEQTGVRSKQRVRRDGSRIGGQPFSRGALYALLSNPIYIGEIAHKEARYAGQHAAILDREIWDEVQERLRSRTPERTRTPARSDSWLLGKLFDERGLRLTPHHAAKGARRYRYYVSRILVTGTAKEAPGAWRLPAVPFENLIVGLSTRILTERSVIATALEKAGLPLAEIPAALAQAERLRQSLLTDPGRGDLLKTIMGRAQPQRPADDPVARPARAGLSAADPATGLPPDPRVSVAY